MQSYRGVFDAPRANRTLSSQAVGALCCPTQADDAPVLKSTTYNEPSSDWIAFRAVYRPTFPVARTDKPLELDELATLTWSFDLDRGAINSACWLRYGSVEGERVPYSNHG
jgi:hypothetical protein